MSIASIAGMYWRFGWGLRGFLKQPITVEQAREIIKQRLKGREENLLALIKRAIYENEDSPYLKLLKLAGCEYGDVEKMILCDGIESALEKLRIAGVYLSLEEFRGRKDVIRGGKTFRFRERDFDNPLILNCLETSSSASRSVGARTLYDFDTLVTCHVIHLVVDFDAKDLFGLPFAQWHSISPGIGPTVLLSCTKAGKPPIKWFSTLHKKSFVRSLKHRMLTNYIVYAGRFFGERWPAPEYVRLDDACMIADWMADAIRDRGGCLLGTYVNNVVRICNAAKEKGLNLTGAKFHLAGEPTTKAKRAEIEATGAIVYPVYAFTEGGLVANACSNPAEADDVHLFEDSIALISHSRQVSHAAISVDAFLFTSLLTSMAKVLLNVENGDYGVVETRSCGCKYEGLGLTKHLSNIRAFDKLTSEGMNLIGTDLVRIMEEVFPARFGGTSIDYQMVEEEDEEGHTRLSILVSPSVGMIDEDELLETVLAELRKGLILNKIAAEMWSKAKTLRVRREQPHATVRGKLLPLHIQARQPDSKASR